MTIVEPATRADAARVEQLFQEDAFAPLRAAALAGGRPPRASRTAGAVAACERGELALCVDGERTAGCVIAAPLDWESHVLGLRVFGIQELVAQGNREERRRAFDALIGWALGRIRGAADTVHIKRYSDDVVACQSLEAHGFFLVDTQLVYGARPGEAMSAPSAPEVALRTATPRDRDGLLDVARSAFATHFGRFHADPGISLEAATRVYVTWIESSLDGYADFIALGDVDGRMAGFSVWRKPSVDVGETGIRVGHYSIGAVHPDFHRRGIFRAVTHYGLALMRPYADLVLGPTHINHHAVQRGYQALGWRILDGTHAFHRWM